MSTSTLSKPISDVSTTNKPELSQRLVLQALRRMNQGHLEITLPNGTAEHIGQIDLPIEASFQIHDNAFFKKCALYGDVGFGESYVDGDWDTPDIASVIRWLIQNIESAPTMSGSKVSAGFVNLLSLINRIGHKLRPNSIKTSRQNIHEHYDLGNDFYRLFLDETMTYSCGLFRKDTRTLEQSQFLKYDRLCQLLKLGPDDHLLEIGCGWGGFASHAAQHYGCKITGVTISEEQLKFTKERMEKEGLDHLVEVQLCDYRHLTGQFDKIVSIEMLEAVGDAYVGKYFKTCESLLKPEGLLAIQMINCPDSRYASFRDGVDWIQKHIFPGSLLMSVGRVHEAINKHTDFHLHDLKDMGNSYKRTLNEWHQRFNSQLAEVKAQGFSDSFIRKWNYYLKYCEAAFDMRNISVTQAVFTRPNNPTLREAAS